MPKKKSSKKKKFTYHLSLIVNDIKWEQDTDDLFSALKSFVVPPTITTDMRIIVTKDETQKEIILNVTDTRRAFYGMQTALELLARDLTRLFE